MLAGLSGSTQVDRTQGRTLHTSAVRRRNSTGPESLREGASVVTQVDRLFGQPVCIREDGLDGRIQVRGTALRGSGVGHSVEQPNWHSTVLGSRVLRSAARPPGMPHHNAEQQLGAQYSTASRPARGGVGYFGAINGALERVGAEGEREKAQ